MKLKKHSGADIEKGRFLFLEIGLVIAILIAGFAIEQSVSTPSETETRLAEVAVEMFLQPTVVSDSSKQLKTSVRKAATLEIVPDDSLVSEDVDFDFEAKNLQNPTPIDYEKEIFVYTDTLPQFAGGSDALNHYLNTQLRYPEIARIQNVQGRVYVSFVVTRTGKISQIRRLNSLSPETNAEAERLIAAMSAWIPGKHAGRKVNVCQTLAVTFSLETFK